jgi:hypothetical protein
MTDDERASFDNGIWLCANCHTMVDKNKGADFQAEVLIEWKKSHETMIRSLLYSHRSPLPILRRFTKEGVIAQEAVDILEQHGALFVDMIQEVDSHVMLSIERLRAELKPFPRRVKYDVRLKELLKDLAGEIRDFMNRTSGFPGNIRSELPALRSRVGIYLLRLRDEFGCKVRGPSVGSFHRFVLFMAQPNNGMHPTALSVPLINLISCDAGCVLSSSSG